MVSFELFARPARADGGARRAHAAGGPASRPGVRRRPTARCTSPCRRRPGRATTRSTCIRGRPGLPPALRHGHGQRTRALPRRGRRQRGRVASPRSRSVGRPSASPPSPSRPSCPLLRLVAWAACPTCSTAVPRPLVDSFGRVHRDLRISVTDRCNFRCTYCMPAEGMQWLPAIRGAHLRGDRAVRPRARRRSTASDSIRLTGGEPTVRAHLPVLVDEAGRPRRSTCRSPRTAPRSTPGARPGRGGAPAGQRLPRHAPARPLRRAHPPRPARRVLARHRRRPRRRARRRSR